MRGRSSCFGHDRARPICFLPRHGTLKLLIQHLVQVHQLVHQHRPGRQRRSRRAPGRPSTRRRRSASSRRPASPCSRRAARPAIDSTIFSSSRRERPGEQSLRDEVDARPSVLPPSFSAFSASTRAASTNCTSLSVTSACSGVLVRSRRTVQVSRFGALKMSIEAGGAARFQNVYMLRRYRFSPVSRLVVAGVAADHRHRFPHAVRLVRLHARAAELADQQAARRQGVVADHLGVHAEARAAREQPVVAVLLELLRRRRSPPAGRSRDVTISLKNCFTSQPRLAELDRPASRAIRDGSAVRR